MKTHELQSLLEMLDHEAKKSRPTRIQTPRNLHEEISDAEIADIVKEATNAFRKKIKLTARMADEPEA